MSAPELSRPVRIDTIGPAAHAMTIEADHAERAGVAPRFGLVAVERLRATAELARTGEAVTLSGRLEAAVVQACVASGEPVAATIDEPFALRFAPDDEAGEEVELDAADLDVIAYEGGEIDVGEAVAQTLALALDPFPRAPDADRALRAAGVIGEAEAGPFGALKALRDRLGS